MPEDDFRYSPLNCYKPQRRKEKLDVRDYYNQVIRRHAQEVDLHFPDAQMDAGVFLVMDPHTGQPIKQLGWQEDRVERSDKYYWQTLLSVETTPVLTAARIAAAIAMVA